MDKNRESLYLKLHRVTSYHILDEKGQNVPYDNFGSTTDTTLVHETFLVHPHPFIGQSVAAPFLPHQTVAFVDLRFPQR